MEKIKKNQTDTLNMLIEINNDRIEGYKAAIGLLPSTANITIRTAFEEYRDQSIQFNTELIPLVFQDGEYPEEGTRASGKLFRIWMDIKAMISPSTTKSILASCERGEEEHEKVYFKALDGAESLNATVLLILESQSLIQTKAHNHIKQLNRDFIEEPLS
ncbi:PA2169 family four-helix-bundle protein [Sphingobacterium sp. MYb382]|uniref:PA2169 family four-helix-bundle protein n=1 Tax=Sphingobacterium sp. MYb382 TaxID=2745278 RepID=UPI0030990284